MKYKDCCCHFCPLAPTLCAHWLKRGATPSVSPAAACAGHSLGGALAQLAAFDIVQRAREEGLPLKVEVYTFGAPRVGNHAFAREYNEVYTPS